MAPARAPTETSLIGAVLSRRYVLKHEIGRGGMGAVYAAEPVGGGAPVAIKILHAYFLNDENVLKRFLEEGRTCMRLQHPNILRVHECLAAEDGSPYLVMDLLEGIPLSAYTNDGGRVALGHAVPILQGMLAGLEAAHALGVVHRDLKPGNVFLARTGGVFSVKLLDFGIAKVMDAAGGMGNKTSTGALLGTPAYMSPEQVTSAKGVDGRSDLWSVGVMFYEMLSGRVAFPAPTEYARLAAVISAKPIPIQSIDPDLACVGAFLEKALEKDREHRFQSAREMSVALATIAPLVSAMAPNLETGNEPRPAFRASPKPGALAPPRSEAAAWSIATDKAAAPSEVEPVIPPVVAFGERKDVLIAQVMAAPQTSTLASPNRNVAPSTAPPPHPSAAVVIVPEEALAEARARETLTPADVSGTRAPLPRKIVIAVFVAVAVAFTIGFVLGLVVGQARF
jgi:serine/threonine protein kinase